MQRLMMVHRIVRLNVDINPINRLHGWKDCEHKFNLFNYICRNMPTKMRPTSTIAKALMWKTEKMSETRPFDVTQIVLKANSI